MKNKLNGYYMKILFAIIAFLQYGLGQTPIYAQTLNAQNDTIFVSADAIQSQQITWISIFNNDQIDSLSFDFIDVSILNEPLGYLYYDACFCDMGYANIAMTSGAFFDSFTYQIMGYAGGNYYYSQPATVLFLEDCETDCVFVGDTDSNGTVNILDLLPIGLANGTVGLPRALSLLPYDTAMAQIPQAASAWTNILGDNLNFGNDVNYKHADCNGDGIINATDTLFVAMNYGHTNPNPTNTYTPLFSGAEYGVYLDIHNTSVAIGDTVVADIMIGNSSVDVYGMAFSISHNVVDSGTMRISFPNSFLNDDGQIMYMQRRNNIASVEAVITRTNQQPRFGQGKVGTVSFIMEDVLEGKTESEMLQLAIENVMLIGANGTYLTVPETALNGDEVQFTGIKPFSQPSVGVTIYPNPANDYCVLDWSNNKKQTIDKVVLMAANGQQLAEYLPAANAQTLLISTSNLITGIYTLQIYTNDVVQTSQLVINNFR